MAAELGMVVRQERAVGIAELRRSDAADCIVEELAAVDRPVVKLFRDVQRVTSVLQTQGAWVHAPA